MTSVSQSAHSTTSASNLSEPTRPTQGTTTLSPGAITGIAIRSLTFVTLQVLLVLFSLRKFRGMIQNTAIGQSSSSLSNEKQPVWKRVFNTRKEPHGTTESPSNIEPHAEVPSAQEAGPLSELMGDVPSPAESAAVMNRKSDDLRPALHF